MIFRLQLTRQVHFGTGNMAMNINTTRHDYHAAGVYLECINRDRFYYLSIFDTDVLYQSIDR